MVDAIRPYTSWLGIFPPPSLLPTFFALSSSSVGAGEDSPPLRVLVPVVFAAGATRPWKKEDRSALLTHGVRLVFFFRIDLLCRPDLGPPVAGPPLIVELPDDAVFVGWCGPPVNSEVLLRILNGETIPPPFPVSEKKDGECQKRRFRVAFFSRRPSFLQSD